MSKETRANLLFVFAAVQAIGGLVAILLFFGITPERLRSVSVPLVPSVWWLAAGLFLFATSIGLSMYGLWKQRQLSWPLGIKPNIIALDPGRQMIRLNTTSSGYITPGSCLALAATFRNEPVWYRTVPDASGVRAQIECFEAGSTHNLVARASHGTWIDQLSQSVAIPRGASKHLVIAAALRDPCFDFRVPDDLRESDASYGDAGAQPNLRTASREALPSVFQDSGEDGRQWKSSTHFLLRSVSQRPRLMDS